MNKCRVKGVHVKVSKLSGTYEAYILLKVSRDIPTRGVVNEIRRLPHVEEAEILFGDYDAIVKIKAEKVHEIENFVIDKITSIEGVERTMTMLCVDEEII